MERLKEEICEAFCSNLQITEFEGGYAIGTPYSNRAGDKIGIYAVRSADNTFRLIDNALTMAFLETEGATLEAPSRRKVLIDLFSEYGAEFDEDMGEIYIDGVKISDVARRILDFSALILRVNDLSWLSQERTKNTFKEA